MKRYSMELGSKNVTIVMPDADLDLAVEGIAWGAFATSGQRCTATSRVVRLHREAGPHALDEFSEWKAVSIDFGHRLQKAQFQPGE